MLEIDMLKAQRLRCGLTQEGIARMLNVSYVSVNCWENGRHAPKSEPTIEAIRALTKELSKRKGEYVERK